MYSNIIFGFTVFDFDSFFKIRKFFLYLIVRVSKLFHSNLTSECLISDELAEKINSEYSSEFKNEGILNRIGYMILESNFDLDWAVEVFRLNTVIFPNEGNLWDSLGDGYLAVGQKEEAINSFKKALELKTITDCFWCEHSSKKLKDLLKVNN